MSNAIYYNHKNITASTLINTGSTKLGGIFCASTTSGTVKVWDNTAASGTVCVNTFNLTAGTYYTLPANLKNGCYITIANTADITVFYV